MAVSEIQMYDMGAGTYDLNKSIFSGYTTGSGNYLYIFIPGRFPSNLTATISIQGMQISLESGQLSQANIDTSYTPVLEITQFGIRVELKFTSTQGAYKPLTTNIQGSLTLT